MSYRPQNGMATAPMATSPTDNRNEPAILSGDSAIDESAHSKEINHGGRVTFAVLVCPLVPF